LIPDAFWNAAIQWLHSRHGWDVRREWLARSPGIVCALNLCVKAFTHPGDKIVIQTPVYHPFHYSVENNGRRLVRNPLKRDGGRFVMDLEDLDRRIDADTRMLILCNPHNPVGRVWTRAELEALGRIAIARDLIVVSDEIHGDLIFPPHRHVPFASLSPEIAARTVTTVAPSKTFNVPGLTTAIVIASDPRLLHGFNTELQRSGLEVGNIFGLTALEAAYTQGAGWLDDLLVYLEGNMDTAGAFFETRVPRIRFLRPEGTYLALLDCRNLGLAPEAIKDFFLKKAKVLFDEGGIFGDELQGFMRMNLACPRALLLEALGRIERAVAGLA